MELRAALLQEGRKRVESVKNLLLIMIATSVGLWILPYRTCQYIAQNFSYGPVLISCSYIFFTIYMVLHSAASIVRFYRREDFMICPKTKHSFSIWVTVCLYFNVLMTGILYLNVKAGERLMRKFAYGGNSYFRIEQSTGIWEWLFNTAILFPVFYLVIYLFLYERNRYERKIGAAVVAYMLYSLVRDTQMANWLDWIVKITLAMILIWRAVILDKKIRQHL